MAAAAAAAVAGGWWFGLWIRWRSGGRVNGGAGWRASMVLFASWAHLALGKRPRLHTLCGMQGQSRGCSRRCMEKQRARARAQANTVLL